MLGWIKPILDLISTVARWLHEKSLIALGADRERLKQEERSDAIINEVEAAPPPDRAPDGSTHIDLDSVRNDPNRRRRPG